MSDVLLNIGSRGLAAMQASLGTVAHNVANANTAGYSRQEAVLATAGSQFTGGGFFGRGVELTTVRRQYDQFLTAAVQSSASTSAADRARADGLQQLDAVFSDTDLGIGAAMDDFFAAAGDLATRPADTSARQVLVARASQLADRFRSVGGQIAALATDADQRLGVDAAQVGTSLATIRQLNDRIAQARVTGQPPNDLLDQRDAALQALNGLVSVRVVAQDDGGISLFTQGGAPLLVGTMQATLQAVPDPADPSRHALRLSSSEGTRLLDADALGGGSLAGTLRLRDVDLSAALDQVGRLAAVVASAFNAQQALGVDASGRPGAPLFTVPAPVAAGHAANTGSAAITAAIADASALQPSDYDVRWDGGSWTVRRLADGATTTTPSLPTTVDGLSIGSSGAPGNGDSWRVRALAGAATGVQARPLAPSQVATGFAATLQAAAGNRGSLRAAGFAVAQPGAALTQPVTITFNDPPTTFDVTGLAGGTLANVPYTPGARVPATGDWNGWSATLDGAPAAGDSVSLKPVAAPASDNRNALALAALARAGLVDGGSLASGYAALVGDVGTRVQSGTTTASVSDQLHADAVARQQSVSGVDLDEEAAELLRYQQAYQACARIVQASQSLFDTLLSATGR